MFIPSAYGNRQDLKASCSRFCRLTFHGKDSRIPAFLSILQPFPVFIKTDPLSTLKITCLPQFSQALARQNRLIKSVAKMVAALAIGAALGLLAYKLFG